MFPTAFTVALFILYIFYLSASSHAAIPKPATPYAPQTSPFIQEIVSKGNTFQVVINSQAAWTESLPDHYTVHQGKILDSDVCFGQPNGTRLLATGKPLYDYIHLFTPASRSISNSPYTVQDKRIFYFTCQNDRIHDLDTCPPGHLFHDQTCNPIDQCSGQADGKTFAIDIHSYYECQKELSVRKTCPASTVFLHDSCVSTEDAAVYCQFHQEPKIVNPTTLLVCRNHQPMYETCPNGFRYFDRPICESDKCHGQLDGALLPLAPETQGPFTYSPGYMVCQQHKVVRVEMCPRDWDSHLSEGDDLTHLPMVFDGKTCSVPSFCTNVTSPDPDILVPVHEFTKHVSNWKYADKMDRVTGYTCPRKRVALDPGMRISKRFKPESACDPSVRKVPVSGRPDAYYDCSTRTVEQCPPNYYFDTVLCIPRIPQAFSYHGIDFFAFSGLRADNWIQPWDYLSKKIPVEVCTRPETVFLSVYNVCSHPDCAVYPFLSQTSFPMVLPDGSRCLFDPTTRRLKRKRDTQKVWYWSQRPMQDGTAWDDTCVPGKRIQSGNFVWDSTLYMTCDEQNPFIFCPSPDTRGIELIQGKKYACVPSKDSIPPGTKISFIKHEVKRIMGKQVIINGQMHTIPPEGLPITEAITLETLTDGVNVEYQHRVTYPPDVVLGETPQVSNFGGGFLMKRQDFTLKPLVIPRHDVVKQAVDFKL